MEDIVIIIVNDEDFFGFRVGYYGKVGDYFLVGKFIMFGGLDDVV